MSGQSNSGNPSQAWYRKVAKGWEIDRLLTDLEANTQERYRQNTKKDLLLGVLCGYSLQKIGQDLLKKNNVVRAGLSSIYRDIETLTGQSDKTVRASNLIYILEKHGYRKGVEASSKHHQTIINNLPSPTYTEFIGRDEEMRTLLERLSTEHGAHMITVHGIGGVGKTALVLAAAYLCLKASRENLNIAPKFDAIIFTSAKQQELIPSNGIVQRQQGQRNLREIFQEIGNALSNSSIIQSLPNDQSDRIRQILAKQQTLLIVDNMETIEDRNIVIEFLYNLPICVKVVITTRERIALLPISLKNLTKSDGLQLIQQQAGEKCITLKEQESELLYDRTGGIPLAIVYALGQVCSGYSLDSVLEKLAIAIGDVARFCFEQSVRTMRGLPAHRLLMSLAIFPKFPTQATVAEVAGLTTAPDAINDGLALLQRLSLVNYNSETQRYEMLSLTREYALAELAANPEFQKKARQRWVKWYLDFANSYGGEDWEKSKHYEKLEAEDVNLRDVLYWCKNQDHYEEVRDLALLLNHYVNLYVYWNDRLDWWQWLIEQSERRGEWSSLVQFIIRKTWLLIRERSEKSLKEAEDMLLKAWLLRDHADLCDQADLAENMARLRIRQKNYANARTWLNTEQKLVTQANLIEQKHIRYYIPVFYHRAVILYQEHNYAEAKMLFQEVMQSAEKINWYRVINSAQNWLADIAIELGDRDVAQKLLTKGIIVADRSKNKRRLARYQRSLAKWYKKWGRREQADKLAREAMDAFQQLGMTQDVQEMQSLIDGS